MKNGVGAKMSVRGNGCEAVSPVVGVMLMLVVVLILAAVVTSFAGGMMDTSRKLNNVGIQATYSQTDGLAITNMGGVPLETKDIDFVIRLPGTFGDYEHMTWTVDHAKITSKRFPGTSTSYVSGGTTIKYDDNVWLKKNGQVGVYMFAPGDTAYVKRYEMPKGHDSYDFKSNSPPYSIQSRYHIGKEFIIELVDKSGNTLATTKAMIVK